MKNEKLPKTFKKKWVDALMSGEYEQGTNRLKGYASNKYCCLGVACAASGIAIEELAKHTFIPEDTLFEPIPDLIKGGAMNNTIVGQLVSLNDWEVPFEVIAGVINEYL